MSVSPNNFNAEDFCSRKLLEIVHAPQAGFSNADLEQAVAELAVRRHYLEQLRELGKLSPTP